MRTGYGSVNVSGFVHLVMMHALIQMILADVIRCHLATFVRMMRLEVVLFVINRTAKKKKKKKKLKKSHLATLAKIIKIKYLLGPELSAIVEMARLGFGGTGGEILWGKAGKF